MTLCIYGSVNPLIETKDISLISVQLARLADEGNTAQAYANIYVYFGREKERAMDLDNIIWAKGTFITKTTYIMHFSFVRG